MTSRERVITTLKRGIPDRVPYMEGIVEDEIASKIVGEKIEVKWSIAPGGDFLQSGESLAVMQKKVCRAFNKDNINFCAFAPIYASRSIDEKGKEIVGEGLIKTREDLSLVQFPDPKSKKFVEQAKEFIKNKEDFCSVGAIRLGIGAVIMSMGLEAFSYALVDDPNLITELLDMYCSWTEEAIPVLEEIGFDIFWAFDDVAFNNGPAFSPNLYREVVLPRLSSVAKKIQVPWISHSDGNMMPIIQDWVTLGMNAIHPIQPDVIDIFEVKEKYGDKVCIIGNIDMQNLAAASPEDIDAEVKTKIERIGKGGGYIISSSNSITNIMKVENVKAMIKAIDKYGWYRR